MRRITPFLWFDGRADEAMNFYASIFSNVKIGDVMRSGDAGPGRVMEAMMKMIKLDIASLRSAYEGN
jgi:predicted 3-demethylubiquinone-9 3-methyltransferase (glyoxalase superfamily)